MDGARKGKKASTEDGAALEAEMERMRSELARITAEVEAARRKEEELVSSEEQSRRLQMEAEERERASVTKAQAAESSLEEMERELCVLRGAEREVRAELSAVSLAAAASVSALCKELHEMESSQAHLMGELVGTEWEHMVVQKQSSTLAAELEETEARLLSAQKRAEEGALSWREQLLESQEAHNKALLADRDRAKQLWRSRLSDLQAELQAEMSGLTALARPQLGMSGVAGEGGVGQIWGGVGIPSLLGATAELAGHSGKLSIAFNQQM